MKLSWKHNIKFRMPTWSLPEMLMVRQLTEYSSLDEHTFMIRIFGAVPPYVLETKVAYNHVHDLVYSANYLRHLPMKHFRPVSASTVFWGWCPSDSESISMHKEGLTLVVRKLETAKLSIIPFIFSKTNVMCVCCTVTKCLSSKPNLLHKRHVYKR